MNLRLVAVSMLAWVGTAVADAWEADLGDLLKRLEQ